MLKKIAKLGNSQGLILDAALLDLAGLKVGDTVNITIHDGGSMLVTPVGRSVPPERVTETIRKTVKDYRRTLRRLA